MAMNCLLVDTFYQFENGLEKTKDNKNCYVTFLQKYMCRIISCADMAERFYKDIRCGILHSAQTQNRSMLAFENGAAVEYINGHASIKVNIVKFSDELGGYFREYIERIRSGEEKTQENFITKMHYVCR